jgi:lipopolysaccharide export system permease protein
MRLLDRYLLRELLIPLGFCLGGFLIFWDAGDLIAQLANYQSKHLLAADIAEYYAVKIPEFLVLVMPIALLLALLFALTNHSRHNEITAMRAAGISIWRVCAPYFLVGLGFSLLSLALNEFFVPAASDLSDEILARRSAAPGVVTDKDIQTNAQFRNAHDHRIWQINTYNFKTHSMQGPKVTTILPDGSSWWLIAASAEYTNGVWTFFDAERYDVTSPHASEPKLILKTNTLAVAEFSETPDRINRELRINRRLSNFRGLRATELSINEILDYLQLHREDLTPRDASWLHTQLQGRLAGPWTCLVVVLIAIPFGARSGRRNVFAGVASGIVICFAYFVLLRAGLALGTGGLVPAWVGAWLPNIVFTATGLWMTLRAG